MPTNIKLLSSGAVAPGLARVVAAFRGETGHEVEVTFATAPELSKQLTSGAAADVVIAPPDLLGQLVSNGKAAADWITLGRIGVGVMVRSGAPPPIIATVAEFKQSLLSAETIVYNQASTGVYLENLFERLGIAAPVKAKTARYPDFAAVLSHVRAGQGREIGFGATTVIIESAGKGVIFAGPLPAEIQNYTTYGAALNAQSKFSPAPVEFLAYLTRPAAKALWAAAGIDPVELR